MSEGEKFVFSGIILLALLEGIVFGYGWGKRAADRWWQADEAKKAQTIRNWIPHWGMDGTFCGDNSGCYTMKDGLCVSGDCLGKPTRQILWQSPRGAISSGECLHIAGAQIVPIPCPKAKEKP